MTALPHLVELSSTSVDTFALVDPADAALVSAYRWRLHPRGYAVAHIGGAEVLMHRFLLRLSPGDGHEVDHLNRCKLDNRRCNLRQVTPAENHANHPGFGGASEHRGVFASGTGKWVAKVRIDGRLHHVGTYVEEAEAARAAEAYRLANMPGARAEHEKAAA